MRSRPLVTLGALAILILIWGSTWAVIRIGLQGMPPLTGIALRFAIAAAFLLALAAYHRIPLGRQPLERRLWVVNTLLSFSVSYGVVYWAEQWIPSALAAVLFATFPLWVAILAHWTLPEERMTLRSVSGALLGLVGVVWIFSDDLSRLGGPMILPAATIMLISPVASALGSIAVKRWGTGLHPLSLTAVPMALCSLLMAVLALIFERHRAIDWSVETTGALLYLAIPGSALTFTLYFWLLESLPATRLSLISYGVPIVAVGIGVLALDEPVTLGMIAGTGLVLIGVALAMRPTAGLPEHRQGDETTLC